MPWKNCPVDIQKRPSGIDYYLFVDESGEHILENFDKTRPVFTVAGVLINNFEYNKIKYEADIIKERYWKDGEYTEKGIRKKTCFINRAIRRRQRAFSKHYLNDLNYNSFIYDLSKFIENAQFNIIASCIDKEKLIKTYKYPFEPYTLSMEFIIERLCKFLHQRHATGLVMMESRGKKEDSFLHQKFLEIYNKGTGYISSKVIRKTLTGGFYFNKKWYDDYNDSYIGLELADLVAHPIGHFSLTGEKSKAFNVIESKFLGYPTYKGVGLKIFP